MAGVMLASHQPDFAPWSGFWHKMDRADEFDLALWDRYSTGGYHRRVKMNGEWVGVQVPKSEKGKRLVDVQFRWAASRDGVMSAVRLAYGDAPHGQRVVDLVDKAFVHSMPKHGELAHLASLNLLLILEMKHAFEIATMLRFAGPLTQPKEHGVVELCEHYGRTRYLSGEGAREYQDPQVFADAGIELAYTIHDPPHGNSALEILAWEDDPIEVIRRVR